jgi:hypothetical protein
MLALAAERAIQQLAVIGTPAGVITHRSGTSTGQVSQSGLWFMFTKYLYSMGPTADAKNCVARKALLFRDFERRITP